MVCTFFYINQSNSPSMLLATSWVFFFHFIKCSCFLLAGRGRGELLVLYCKELVPSSVQRSTYNKETSRIRVECSCITALSIFDDRKILIGEILFIHSSHSLETDSARETRKILNEIKVFMVYEPEKWSALNTKLHELLLLNKQQGFFSWSVALMNTVC